MFLSLSSSYTGNACAVRQSINIYTEYLAETQFFDRLVTSMKSVNEILEGKPIIFESNHIYHNSTNNTTINFKNFHLLTSHHDIIQFNENSINEITEKYNRRYERLINIIKEQKKIKFIRYCKNQQNIEEEEIIKFYKNINIINPNLVFDFILISDYSDLIIPTNLIKDNFIYINLNNYTNNELIDGEIGATKELKDYCQILKKYKCVFDIVK